MVPDHPETPNFFERAGIELGHNRKTVFQFPKKSALFVLRFLVCLLVLCAPISFAAAITVSYSGGIDYSNVPGIGAGDTFTGTLTYNTGDSLFAGSPTEALYSLDQPGDGIVLGVSGFSFSVGESSRLYMSLLDGPSAVYPTGDLMGVALGGSPTVALATNYVGLAFGGIMNQFAGNLNLLNGTGIPTQFDPANVILGSVSIPTAITIQFADPKDPITPYAVIGYVTAIQSSTQTPEPGSWQLLSIGLALTMTAGTRWRKRHGHS